MGFWTFVGQKYPSLKEQAPKDKNSRGREERHLYLFTLLLREQWKSKTKLA
jgi:hypothetical protein